jgi:hypothetical protein
MPSVWMGAVPSCSRGFARAANRDQRLTREHCLPFLYYKFNDNELRAELLSHNSIQFDPSHLTAEFLESYRARSKREISAANRRAHELCLYRLAS